MTDYIPDLFNDWLNADWLVGYKVDEWLGQLAKWWLTDQLNEQVTNGMSQWQTEMSEKRTEQIEWISKQWNGKISTIHRWVNRLKLE